MDAGQKRKDAARAHLAARRGGPPVSDAQLVDDALNAVGGEPVADDSEVNRFVEDEMRVMRAERRTRHRITLR